MENIYLVFIIALTAAITTLAVVWVSSHKFTLLTTTKTNSQNQQVEMRATQERRPHNSIETKKLSTSPTAHKQQRIEKTINFWLDKRGRTRERLEDFLGMELNQIAAAIVDRDSEITASVAKFIGIHSEMFHEPTQQATYFPEQSQDTGVMTWEEAHAGIEKLAEQIVTSGYYPDWLLAVLDPDAPGGVTVGGFLIAELIQAYSKQGISAPSPVLGTITIEGRIGGLPREVTDCTEPPPGIHKVLVVDDVTLSGKTFDLADKYLEKTFPALEVRHAALFTSKEVAHQKTPGKVKCDYYAQATTRETVIFPWGPVQYTGELNRFYEISEGKERKVAVGTRPWGRYEEFALNEHCTVRILTVYPNQQLSLQRHKRRDEFFVALDEGLRLQIGEETLEPIKGDYMLILRDEWHRMGTVENWDQPARVLEVSFGEYDQVGDIERKDDRYGRVHLDGSI